MEFSASRMPNKAMEFAPGGRPTRKQLCRLLAAHRWRWAQTMVRTCLLVACIGFFAVGCNRQEPLFDQPFDSIRERSGSTLIGPKGPWEYTELAPNRELLNLAAWAIEHHHTLGHGREIFLQGFFQDSERGFIYIGFDRIRDSSGPFIPDAYLAYIYDPSEERMRGYFSVWP
jgi:hypothetical protein